MPAHHPPHLYQDDTWYITTAATCHHAPLLTAEAAKNCLRDTVRMAAAKLQISIRAWVILDNHYHLLLKPKQGADVARFFGQVHGRTARQINLEEGAPGRQVWHNFWDTCIRTESDFWTRFNYIHQNPVKHGYVREPEDWPFSSYQHYQRTRGTEWLQDCWMRYPVIDFLAGDNFA